MNHYFTFGQSHAHRIQGKTLDCNHVAVVSAPTHREARAYIFGETEGLFGFSYTEDDWDEESMKFFPGGYVHLELGR